MSKFVIVSILSMKLSPLLLLTLFTTVAKAQELPGSRQTVDTLTSSTLWGRGYTRDGMAKAAQYISHAFEKAGLQPMEGKDFSQHFSYPVNTFPGKMEVAVNGKKLIPGRDYLIEPSSTGISGTQIPEVQADSITFIARKERLLLILQDKLTWSVSQKAENYTAVLVNKKALSEKPVTVDISVENKLVPDFNASNICGIVRGTRQPDSVMMITAHYDHLGGMGAQTFFPGANDNASGISLLLELAKYFAAHPQPYSIGFICFAGEEAGLLGSRFFTSHPPFPLKNIKFLINTDMVGTGEKGITVVNATIHPQEYTLLNRINARHKYLPKINSRGKAANSDHYPFTELGVPAFFMYTEGGISAYHDVYDVAPTLPLNKLKELYHLLIDFEAALMN